MLFTAKKLAFVSTFILLSACGDSDDTMTMTEIEPEPTLSVTYRYQVKVTNLTAAQPFSPVLAMLHNDGIHADGKLWQVGLPAHAALENLAESGSGAELSALSLVQTSSSGAGMLLPGASETIEVSLVDIMPSKLSVATMLVNTNDAFTGKTGIDISTLMVGESIDFITMTYDAGTEENSETATTIPGPAGGGEGFNAMRDDTDFVSAHNGVISIDDGLMNSTLNSNHRFDNPTMKMTLTRME